MRQHEYFDLLVHSDDELAELTGSKVIKRTTMHEWPLSSVQKVVFQDGRKLVYKTAGQPTIEALFYAQAQSPLLPDARLVYQRDGYECLLIEWVDAPRLEVLSPSPAFVLGAGRLLLASIAQIQGDLPCYIDLRGLHAMALVEDQILSPLSALFAAGKLVEVDKSTINELRSWIRDPSMKAVFENEMGLVHADLSVDNCFYQPDGSFRLIDWQRPIYGPPALDLAQLLESSGLDPQPYVDRDVMRLKRLLTVHWLAQCAWRWFPQGVQTYDHQIATLTEKLEAGI